MNKTTPNILDIEHSRFYHVIHVQNCHHLQAGGFCWSVPALAPDLRCSPPQWCPGVPLLHNASHSWYHGNISHNRRNPTHAASSPTHLHQKQKEPIFHVLDVNLYCKFKCVTHTYWKPRQGQQLWLRSENVLRAMEICSGNTYILEKWQTCCLLSVPATC